MRGIVWGRFLTHAVKQLEVVENNYINAGIPVTKKVINQNKNYILFENGDIWEALPAKEVNRGHSSNVAYIENTIPEDIIKTLILPCTKALPFTAIHRYVHVPPAKEKEE